MRFYRIGDMSADKPAYERTLKDAHTNAKGLADTSQDPDDIRIELVEIKIDHNTLCDILSGWSCQQLIKRSWRLTKRKGLKECPIGGVTVPTYTQEQLDQARKAGNFLVSASPHEFGVAFIEQLQGPKGMHFTLFCEPHHTLEHIAAAKRWLRNHRDVVGFRVLLPA